VNLRGQAVGILGLKIPPAEDLSFAVPINYLRALLASASANLTLDQLREALGKGPVGFQDKLAGPIPRFWKSASTATRYAVRMDGDRIYAERILPDVQRNGNTFTRIEAQRSGRLYVGKVYYSGTCGTVSCPFEDQAEFELVTPNRIEGAALRYPVGEVVDCQPCQVSKAKQIIKFVWTPE